MEHLISLLETYKYLILLPLAIIEGPILAIIAGFLITLGVLNVFAVFFIVALGDVIGDGIMYMIGRWGGKPLVTKIGPYLGITDTKLEEARNYFTHKHTKAVALSKLVHGIGFVGLITAGILKMPYRKFAITCILISLGQAVILITVGILFGHAYTILSKYLDYYAAGISVLAVATALIIIIQIKRKRS